MRSPDVPKSPNVVHVHKAFVLRSLLDLVEQNRTEVAGGDQPVIHPLIITPLLPRR